MDDGVEMNTLTTRNATFQPCYSTFLFGCHVQVQGPVSFYTLSTFCS